MGDHAQPLHRRELVNEEGLSVVEHGEVDSLPEVFRQTYHERPHIVAETAIRGARDHHERRPDREPPGRYLADEVLVDERPQDSVAVSYTHLRAHETRHDL